MTKKIILIILLIIIVISILIIIFRKKEYEFKIHFFNVDKADSILINYKDKYMLIDTAKNSDRIVDYLKKNNINTLDYLIITHFDKDHVGGAYDIINKYSIKEILQSNYPKDSDEYNSYLLALKNKNMIPITIENDKSFKLDDLEFNVNGPSKTYTKNESNNSSLIVSINYVNNSFLFTGDIENERVEDFVSINNKTYDFVKIPHHGNYHKRLKDLLQNTKPKYSVITSSNEEIEEEKMVELLQELNIKYYTTRNGDIDIYSDGNKIKIKQ